MAVRERAPFWNKYEIKNNNGDTFINKTANVFNNVSNPLGMQQSITPETNSVCHGIPTYDLFLAFTFYFLTLESQGSETTNLELLD